MKKYLLVLVAGLGFFLTGPAAQADFGTCCYGGYQPKWAFWARSNKPGYYANCEEERWQKFWHDYYDALKCYYGRLDNIDWVTYYKFHGYQINGGAGGGGACNPYCRPQYAPVFVSPSIQWAVPGGAPCGPCGSH
jgi:hypothetical protein